jgi:methyl-accepting chemotaxis protein
MKLRYRLIIIVTAIVMVVGLSLSVILVGRAISMQMATALESQERLAAEQARVIQMRYEGYLQTVRALANAMADYDETEAGRQRNRFNQLIRSVVISDERIVGVFAVFNPNTIDPGMDAAFAGTPGSTETGQWASWYTQRTGALEHLIYNDIPGMTTIINGPNARKEIIDDPMPQTVAGKDTYIVKVSVPVIYRKTGEVVGRVGMNVNTAYLQPVVDDTIKTHPDISAMTVYSDNGTVIASYAPEQIGKLLKDAQSSLFGANTAVAQDAVVMGEKYRAEEYSQILKADLELILYPFTIGETGISWAVMLGTERAVILEEINGMIVYTVIIALVAMLITVVGVFFVAGGITKPIINVALTLKDISEGEGDLTKTVAINSKD